jgi:hypothetical protein
LSDPGTKWTEQITDTMNRKDYNIQTLTFDSGTGDAPDDWYVVYSNPETKKIEVAAYIVTVNKTKEEAEKNPHAIKYDNYTNINDIDLATKWSFWNWNKETGLSNQLAEANLSDVKFIKTVDNFFTPLTNFKEK